MGRRPPEGKVCNVVFDEKWAPCVKRKGFNYNNATGGPCIFLKLNKIFGWVPEYYNKTHLPAHMPQYLKDYISVIEDENQVSLPLPGVRTVSDIDFQLKTVWVTCDGENPADVENIGVVYYHPTRGFTGEYFPFMNQEGYLSPVVAVHFQAPKRKLVAISWRRLEVFLNVICKFSFYNRHTGLIASVGVEMTIFCNWSLICDRNVFGFDHFWKLTRKWNQRDQSICRKIAGFCTYKEKTFWHTFQHYSLWDIKRLRRQPMVFYYIFTGDRSSLLLENDAIRLFLRIVFPNNCHQIGN